MDSFYSQLQQQQAPTQQQQQYQLPPPITKAVMDKMVRFADTTARTQILVQLRELGASADVLTDQEYMDAYNIATATAMIEKIPRIEQWLRRFLVRQIRRLHSPMETARYLKSSFRETLFYTLWLLMWFLVICVGPNYMQYPEWLRWIARWGYAAQMGYLNAKWLYRLAMYVSMRMSNIARGIWLVAKRTPSYLIELAGVLFEVFVGWPLFYSVLGIVVCLYGLPVLHYQMRISSVLDDSWRSLMCDSGSAAVAADCVLPLPIKIVSYVF